MNLLKDKRGFIDMEILAMPGFWALLILTLAATAIGWIGSKQMGMDAFPLWQVLMFMAVEIVIVYIISLKMFD